MQSLIFYKMHDLGNDFIILDQDEQNINIINFKEFLQNICNRKYGIGCDQLITFRKAHKNTDSSHQTNASQQYQLSIYNQDASQAFACGNGMRCVAYLIYKKYQDALPIMLVNSRKIEARVVDKTGDVQVEINMGSVNLNPSWKPCDDALIQYTTRYNLELRDVFFADIGNPHMIIFSDLPQDNMLSIGHSAQNLVKHGVNVSFVHIKNRQLFLKVWEKGVGMTNACGSGACASAAVARYLKFIDNHTQAHFDQGQLTITFDHVNNVVVKGGAHLVATGQFYYKDDHGIANTII